MFCFVHVNIWNQNVMWVVFKYESYRAVNILSRL